MKRYTFLLIIVFTFLATSTLHAQEWSEEQKDIWQVVENLWAMWKTGNSDTTLQFFYKNDLFKRNEEMSLFNSEDDFADTLKEKNRSKRERNYSIEPLRILNYGNIAIVEYKYSASLKIENKGVVTGYKSKSKITWLFTKENGKWIFISDYSTFGNKCNNIPSNIRFSGSYRGFLFPDLLLYIDNK